MQQVGEQWGVWWLQGNYYSTIYLMGLVTQEQKGLFCSLKPNGLAS